MICCCWSRTASLNGKTAMEKNSGHKSRPHGAAVSELKPDEIINERYRSIVAFANGTLQQHDSTAVVNKRVALPAARAGKEIEPGLREEATTIARRYTSIKAGSRCTLLLNRTRARRFSNPPCMRQRERAPGQAHRMFPVETAVAPLHIHWLRTGNLASSNAIAMQKDNVKGNGSVSQNRALRQRQCGVQGDHCGEAISQYGGTP